MERHTLIGADILSGSDSPVLQMAEEIALTHHERWDGEGYPHRLRGEDIPLLGRIVAIADVFDALTHARPYKEAWSVDRTVEHIRGMSGSQFDPDVVAAFSALHHTSLYSFKPPGGPVAGTSRHAEPAEQPRGRGLFVAADEEHVTDRDDAAADRDRAASARDHTAAERDRREAEADRRTSDRDDAASDRDHAAAVRDLVALAREQAASARDRAPGDAGRRASDRDDAAADRDHAAADSRETASDRDQAQLGADERLANRDRAAVDRVLAASDRDQTAADRRAATIDRDAARDQLRRAQIDQLTGALGRGLGMVTLGREINRARHGNGKLVLAFVEVEGLTQVNDRHGRAAGDLLLQQVVAAMQASLRSYDPIVRFGGDEFVCALVDAGPADVDRRFDEVRAKLALAHPGASIRVGLVALRPGDTLDHLTERGDAALHRAKRSRR
jgi:diguanylate cyclase (GGDEF)-like protein